MPPFPAPPPPNRFVMAPIRAGRKQPSISLQSRYRKHSHPLLLDSECRMNLSDINGEGRVGCVTWESLSLRANLIANSKRDPANRVRGARLVRDEEHGFDSKCTGRSVLPGDGARLGAENHRASRRDRARADITLRASHHNGELGVFSMWRARAFGGPELSFRDFARVIEELSVITTLKPILRIQ
jgi:hypothetical protein